MRLEMAEFPVTEVNLGKEFSYRFGQLGLDERELRKLVLQEKCIQDVSFEVVVPGEKVRITGIRDVVEPRVKVGGKGQVFPGILGPVEPVGDGKTHRLSGMAVVASAEYEGTIRSGTAVQRNAILDMWGPGADVSRFSSLVNLVLVLRLARGLSELEAHTAIQRAECEVAKRLAEATIGLSPEEVDVYDTNTQKSGLARVVLIQGHSTDTHHVHSGASYYGLSIRDSLATVVHPNEFLDGAMGINATRAVCHHPTTWDWQNHPLILSLYREHCKAFNFAGVILERVRFETHHGKEVIAHNTAELATQLRADGALVTWVGGGNAFVDVMLTIRACEERGIKTVLVAYEYGGRDGLDSPLLYYVPEAIAVVTTGSRNRSIELPEAEKVVGSYENIQILSYPGAPVVAARSALNLDARDMIVGGVDIWGRQAWTCKEY